MRDQRSDRIGIAVRRRPHERGGAAQRLARVDPSAMIQEQRERCHTAGPRGHHERRLPVRQGLIGIGTSLEQSLDELGTAGLAGERKRGHARIGCDVRVRARREQRGHRLGIGIIDRPVQRGAAVGLGHVHVRVRGQELPQAHRIVPHDGIGHDARRRRGAQLP